MTLLHRLRPTAVVTLVSLLFLACTGGRSAESDKPANLRKSAIQPAATGRNVIQAGQTVNGELEDDDEVLDDDSRYDLWVYRGKEGERLSITMRSRAFDTYVLVAQLGDSGGETLGQDDDGGGGTNSLLSIELPADGEYGILANAAVASGRGDYTLRVVSQPPAVVNWDSIYSPGGDPAERYALVVGIDDYPGDDNDLRGPVNDAQIMREILVGKYGFRSENVVLLTDSAGNRDHIINAFLRHLGKAGPNGVAVFFYSGHGMQMEGNLAVTAPLDPERDQIDEALYIWGRGNKGAPLLDDELGYLADQLQAGRVLLMLDACFAGTGSRAPGPQPKVVKFEDVRKDIRIPREFIAKDPAQAADAAAASRSLAELLNQPRRHILLAASSDTELSWTATGWPKRGGTASVFTYYLADALEAADSNTTFASLMNRVRGETERYTTTTEGYERQTPQVEGTQRNTSVARFLRKR